MKRTSIAILLAVATLSVGSTASAQFLIGPRVGVTVPIPGGGPELGGALDMRVANTSRMIQFGVTLQSSLDGAHGGLAGEFGLSWFLGGATEWVPYAGAGVQVRAMFFDDTRVTSFAAQAQVGLMSSRVGRRRLFVELRAVQNLLPFGAERLLTRQSVATPVAAFRFEPSAHVGFLF
jgi:hypothetical protein